jgi:hypothetical protein
MMELLLRYAERLYRWYRRAAFFQSVPAGPDPLAGLARLRPLVVAAVPPNPDLRIRRRESVPEGIRAPVGTSGTESEANLLSR